MTTPGFLALSSVVFMTAAEFQALPPYVEAEPCPKCTWPNIALHLEPIRNAEVMRVYREQDESAAMDVRPFNVGKVIRHTCGRCGCWWDTRTADESPRQATVTDG